MTASISKNVTPKHLLKFALPTIISIVLMSLFGTIDGIFVSRLIDHKAFSAVGIVFPFVSFTMAIGFMLGVGGNALIAKKLGQGKEKEAQENFTLITLVAFGIAIVIAVLGMMLPGFLINVLGANEEIAHLVLEYLRPLLYFLPLVVLSMIFQQFFITIGKAHIITITTFAGGLISAGSNYFLIYVMQMGLRGAAISTSVGLSLSAIVGIVYFIFNRSGSLYFVKPKFDIYAIGRSCINGASEMVAMLSISITAIVMNNRVIEMQGHEAVAAIGIAFAGMGIITSIFIGYSSGIAPIISFNYGKGDTDNLKKIYSYSLRLLGVISTLCIVVAWLLTNPIINLYGVPVGTTLREMSFNGFRIFTAGYIFMAYNTFASMMFTAFNNGKLSTLLSFCRTLVFIIALVLVLPEIFGLNGVWIAVPLAEILAIMMTIYFLKRMKRVYQYA
jgi:Na+-driven multidrug efflux pump